MNRDQPEPLIYEAWFSRLGHRIFADELGELFAETWLWDARSLHGVLRDQPAGAALWCDDITTSNETETCDTQANRAFDEALAALRKAYGDELKNWRWGRAHRVIFAHPILSHLPLIDDIVTVDVDMDGDNHTINRATPLPAEDGARFRVVHGAGLRAVFDLADLDQSRFVIATGQSGNPFSAHYADMVLRWRDGSYVTLAGGTGGPADHTLTLAPE
jgi:penicillin amidase